MQNTSLSGTARPPRLAATTNCWELLRTLVYIMSTYFPQSNQRSLNCTVLPRRQGPKLLLIPVSMVVNLKIAFTISLGREKRRQRENIHTPGDTRTAPKCLPHFLLLMKGATSGPQESHHSDIGLDNFRFLVPNEKITGACCCRKSKSQCESRESRQQPR